MQEISKSIQPSVNSVSYTLTSCIRTALLVVPLSCIYCCTHLSQ